MKKALSYGLIAAMLLGGVIFACSDRKEPAAEKGAIKKMTEETAREAVNQIRTPSTRTVPLRHSRKKKIRNWMIP